MDARITELVARLTALERERVEILAEINTLRSVRSEEAAVARNSGNSEFIDESCLPYLDQWAFLSAIGPMPQAKVEPLVKEASASGKIRGVRIPLVDEDEEP